MKALFLFCLLTIGITAQSQVAINTDGTAPENSAMLDVTSTNKGFLPPRMTTMQRNAIGSPAEGLVIYNTTEKALNVYGGAAWSSMIPVPVFVCGLSITVNHLVSGGVAPVNKTVTYGTDKGITGETSKCWITSNLGADRQATAVSDATEQSAGWYWQFNQMQGFKHDGTTRTPNTPWINFIIGNSEWQAAQDPCTLELGNGWRIPTYSELYNVDFYGNWATWSDPWNTVLKFHAAGYLRGYDGDFFSRGSSGHYWCSSLYSTDFGWYLSFSNGYSDVCWIDMTNGYSLRCIRD